MQSALKFSNASSTPLLKAAGNQTKLFELLVLDDVEAAELALPALEQDTHVATWEPAFTRLHPPALRLKRLIRPPPTRCSKSSFPIWEFPFGISSRNSSSRLPHSSSDSTQRRW